MVHANIASLLPQIVKLMLQHKIAKAYIFGSAVTTHFDENSDVDFLVDMEPNIDPAEAGGHLWDLTYELESLLGRRVDLLTTRSLTNPYFISQINRSKVSIYGD